MEFKKVSYNQIYNIRQIVWGLGALMETGWKEKKREVWGNWIGLEGVMWVWGWII